MDVGDPFDKGAGGPGDWVILDEPELHFGQAPDEESHAWLVDPAAKTLEVYLVDLGALWTL